MHLVSHGRRYVAHQIELFDLTDDPGCMRDLVDAEPGLADSLRSRLIAWLSARRGLGLSGGPVRDAEALAQLSELGYVQAPMADAGAALFVQDGCAWCTRWR